jgi:hypothetical protein
MSPVSLLPLAKLKKKVSILSSRWCQVMIFFVLYISQIAEKNIYLFFLASSSIDIDG